MRVTKRSTVVKALEGGDLTVAGLAVMTGLTPSSIAAALRELRVTGRLKTTTFRNPGDRMRRRAIYSLEAW